MCLYNKKPTDWWVYHFVISIDNQYLRIVILRNRK